MVEDLSIDMLSNDDDDFSLNLDEIQIEDKNENKDDIVNNDSSEENDDSPESVASKDEGKKEPQRSAKSSPDLDSEKLPKVYSSLAAHFQSSGVLTHLDLQKNKVESTEDLNNAIENEVSHRIEENIKRYNDAMSKGEPMDDYVEYSRTKEMLDRITEDSLRDPQAGKTRFNIIAQNFLNRGFEREDAIKHAKRSQELGEDVEDAIKSLEKVKQFNEDTYRSKVADKEAKDNKAVDDVKNFITGSTEIIKGIPLNQKQKDDLLKQMTTPVSRDEKGNPLSAYGKALKENPLKTKTVTEYLFFLTKGFTDFSSMTNLIKSKATSEIDDILKNSGSAFLGGNEFQDTQETFSINDEFDFDI